MRKTITNIKSKASTETASRRSSPTKSHGSDGDGDEKDELNDSSSSSSWITKFALLGDSPLALFFSFGLLLTTAGFSWYLNIQDSLSPEEKAYRKLGPPAHPVGPAKIYQVSTASNEHKAVADQVTNDMKEAYRQDGVVAIRGLIPPDLLRELQTASDQLIQEQHYNNIQQRFKVRGKQFFTVKHSVIFRTPESLQNQTDPSLTTDAETTTTASLAVDNPFVKLIFQTSLPQVAAAFLFPATTFDGQTTINAQGSNLRVLRDILLAKDNDPYTCGWHTDDAGFWPATANAPGINLWIALDDYNETVLDEESEEQEGGFALAVGSHRASWRHEAYHVTGAQPTAPPEGFQSALDMVQRREGQGTCNIAQAAPHLQRRLEETKRVYKDLQAGDVIFHDRWLFHRTIPQITSKSPKPNVIKRRYSVRLGPGVSVIPPGYGTEPSVLYNEKHGGQTANKVSETWPWYPQVWPRAIDTELEAWPDFRDSIWPKALEKQAFRIQELKPFLQRMAQRQQLHPQASNRLFDFSEGYT